MRMRTMAVAALAAATLTIGGSAAAYASAPAPPPPPGAKGTVKVFSCKDGVIKLEATRVVDGEHGVVFSLADGESAVDGSAHPRVHIVRAAPADGPSTELSGAERSAAGGSMADVPTAGAVPARPLPDGVAGVLVTRVDAAGADAPFVEPKEGEPCSALAVPALPALPTQPAK